MTDFLHDARLQALSGIAYGERPADILARLCLDFEKEVPGTRAGVTLLNRSLKLFEGGIFPSLDESYGEALKGIAVADTPGSCALAGSTATR